MSLLQPTRNSQQSIFLASLLGSLLHDVGLSLVFSPKAVHLLWKSASYVDVVRLGRIIALKEQQARSLLRSAIATPNLVSQHR